MCGVQHAVLVVRAASSTVYAGGRVADLFEHLTFTECVPWCHWAKQTVSAFFSSVFGLGRMYLRTKNSTNRSRYEAYMISPDEGGGEGGWEREGAGGRRAGAWACQVVACRGYRGALCMDQFWLLWLLGWILALEVERWLPLQSLDSHQARRIPTPLEGFVPCTEVICSLYVRLVTVPTPHNGTHR